MNTDIVYLARIAAGHYHRKQFRRDGVTPYIKHPESVAARVKHLGPEFEAVALLHDVIEDSGVTRGQLLSLGLPATVVDAVVALTKIEGEDYGIYLARVRGIHLSKTIKIHDMIDNLADNPTLTQLRRYASGLLFLTSDMPTQSNVP